MNILNLTMPRCWQDLTPKQLRYVYYLIAQGYSPDELKTYCLCRWGGIEIIGPEGDGFSAKVNFNLVHITSLQIAGAIRHLDWLDQLPVTPVRLATIGGHTAVAYDLSGVSFENFIVLENLYQGYLHTKDTGLLEQMAAILYSADDITLNEEERISVFYWFAAVKQLFGRKYKHFFVPANAAASGDLQQQLEDGINAQIRALTKGDITKEDIVLGTDCHRALVELDALAREYEELKSQHH